MFEKEKELNKLYCDIVIQSADISYELTGWNLNGKMETELLRFENITIDREQKIIRLVFNYNDFIKYDISIISLKKGYEIKYRKKEKFREYKIFNTYIEREKIQDIMYWLALKNQIESELYKTIKNEVENEKGF